MGRRALIAMATLLVATSTTIPARAEERGPARIAIVDDGLSEDAKDALRRALELETSDHVHVEVIAEGAPERVRVTVSRGSTARDRVLRLDDTAPEARARVVALVASELERSMGASPAPERADAPEVTPSAHVGGVIAPRGDRRSPVPDLPTGRRLGLEIAIRTSLAAPSLAAFTGGELGPSLTFGRDGAWVLGATGRFAYARVQNAAGHAEGTDVGGAIAFRYERPVGAVRLGIGPRVEAGIVGARAEASEDASLRRSTNAGYVATVGSLGLAIPTATGVAPFMGVDGGYAFLGLDGRSGSTPLLGIGGPILTFRLGLAMGLGARPEPGATTRK
ncbi:MAG: hypothetical protein U0169_22355 [Polyangiaceae bacterium]